MPYPEDDMVQQFNHISTQATLDPFHQLVQNLSDVLGPTSGIDSADIDPQDLIDIMARYTSKEQEWSSYALADPTRNYTRNLVDEGNGRSNLLVIVWNPRKSSPVHDHADAHCVMKLLKGSLSETVYTTPKHKAGDDGSMCVSPKQTGQATPMCPLVPMKSTTYGRDQVTYISDSIGLHKITNPSRDTIAVSLHLYTPPHTANFGFRIFDERTGKQTHVKQANFFSDRGEKIGLSCNGSR